MEQKEIKINCPEGFEIDKENSTFECIKFKPIKKELPKTWEEFCKSHQKAGGECYISSASKITSYYNKIRIEEDDKNLLPSKELAEAMLALCQLIQLRDCYNDGWQPNWLESICKYSIAICASKPIHVVTGCDQHILAFKTAELRNLFFRNFKDLIEIAKPLL